MFLGQILLSAVMWKLAIYIVGTMGYIALAKQMDVIPQLDSHIKKL